MSLVVTHLQVRAFRNYDDYTLEPDPSLTVIVGPNAIGKTSLIEAIQLMLSADSFRNPAWADVIKWGSDITRLRMTAQGDGRSLEIELDITPPGRRVYRLNGKTKRSLSEVAGVIPCVVFTPDDLRLVKDSAERRRAAIDLVGSQLSLQYSKIRQEYEKTLRQRNALLKQGEMDPGYFETLTEHLIDVGVRLYTHRKRLFSRMTEQMEPTYRALSAGENVGAFYRSSWGGHESSGQEAPQDLMRESLRQRRAEELARGTTVVGPHRDDIGFTVEGRDARSFASQGQQRTVALAWKLAEVRVISEIAEQPPVLLLDDVMSELDEVRRRALTAFVGESAQTFMTTTNLGYFDADLLKRAKVVELG